MGQNHGGLMKFLNEETQSHMRDLPVQRIEIDSIVANPRNFYGMREIDQLAGMISMSHFVEPLVVRKAGDGKYMLVAGHRRLAAWKKLLTSGEETDTTLPCYVREFHEMVIRHADGTEEKFTPEQLEFFYLMLSNRGQRQERTIEEQLREIRELEPLAKAIWKQKSEEGEYSGNFRKYFAEEVLTISPARLQRRMALANLTPKAQQALQAGKISETAAASIAGMSAEEQDAYIEDIMEGKASAKLSNLKQEIMRRRNGETDDEEPDDDNISGGNAEEDADSADDVDDSSPAEDSDEDSDDSELDADEDDDEDSDAEPKDGRDDRGQPFYGTGASERTRVSDSAPAPRHTESGFANRTVTIRTDVPIAENIENPNKEGNDFVVHAMEPAWEALIQSIEEGKREAEAAGREVEALQWNVRLSVAQVKAAQFRQSI